jgi:hypothetical protein
MAPGGMVGSSTTHQFTMADASVVRVVAPALMEDHVYE